MTVEIKKRIIPKCRTYSEVVDTIRNGIAAKFDAQCVLPSVFDSVVNAECAIAIIVNINVHITVVNYAHIKKKKRVTIMAVTQAGKSSYVPVITCRMSRGCDK